MGEPEALLGLLLDWVHQQAEGSVSTSVDIAPFAKYQGLEAVAALQLVRQGAGQGLLRDTSTMGGPAAFLTIAGVHDVQARQKRRMDPGLRAMAARQGLLRWFYEQHLAGVHMPITDRVLQTPSGAFEGALLTEAEIDRAAGYLADHGLIKGIMADQCKGPLRAEITTPGIDCIEQHGGNVSEYLRGSQIAAGTSINIGTLHNSGALAVGNQGDTTQTIAAGTDPAAMAAFLQTMLRELPKVRLEPEREAAVRAELAEAEREASADSPESERVVGPLGRAVGYLADAGKPALTALFMLLAQHYGGLPPA
jgi:hypothetical protein